MKRSLILLISVVSVAFLGCSLTFADTLDTAYFGGKVIVDEEPVAPTVVLVEPDNNTEADWFGAFSTGSVEIAVYANDSNGDTLEVYFYNRTGGGWYELLNDTDHEEGTIIGHVWLDRETGTNYQWSVNVTDGTFWTNMSSTEYWNFSTPGSVGTTLDTATFGGKVVVNEGATISPYVNISSADPANTTTDINITTQATVSIWIEDNDSTFDWSIELNNTNSSSGSGESSGTKSCNIGGLVYGTTYTWYVNVTDGTDTVNKTLTFTTESAPGVNTTPVIESPNPSDTVTGISKDISSITVWINDTESDNFSYSIETSPDIGSTTGNETSGQKSCSVSSLAYSTEYTWWVNISWYVGDTPPTNKSYTFTTESEPISGETLDTAYFGGKVIVDVGSGVNQSPVIEGPTPIHTATDVDIDTTSLTVWINDTEGDTFNYTIETNPSIGGKTGTDESSGQKTVDISGNLSYSTSYTWWINITSYTGETVINNRTYTFTTESDIGVGSCLDTAYFGGKVVVNETETPPPSNTPPEQPVLVWPLPNDTTLTEWNQTTGSVNLTVLCNDTDNDTMLIRFYNCTGGEYEQISFSINDTEGYGTITWTNLELNTTYNWNVSIYDSINITYQTGYYSFTTPVGEMPWTNTPSEHTLVYPTDGGTITAWNVTTGRVNLTIDVVDDDGNTTNASFYTGAGILIGTQTGLNTSLVQSWTGLTNGTTNYWYVNLWDGNEWNNQTGNYSFTTNIPESPNQDPNASFTYSKSALVVKFNDTSTDSDGTIALRNWSFGDGEYSSKTKPNHTYDGADTYTVNLTVIDNDGASDIVSKNITVTENDTVVWSDVVAIGWTSNSFIGGGKPRYTVSSDDLGNASKIAMPKKIIKSGLFSSGTETISTMTLWGVDIDTSGGWFGLKQYDWTKLAIKKGSEVEIDNESYIEWEITTTDISKYDVFVLIPQPTFYENYEWWLEVYHDTDI